MNNKINKKKYIISNICYGMKECETKNNWKDEWLNYFPNNTNDWNINVELKPMFNSIKQLDFKTPIEKMEKYYKIEYFNKLLKTLKKYKFKKIYNHLYINDDDYEINQILNYYIYNFPNIFLLNIWPINKNLNTNNIKNLLDLLTKYGFIHFIKELNISYKQAQPLFFQLYADKNDMKNLPDINNKISSCGWNYKNKDEKKKIYIIFYEPNHRDFLSGKDSKLKTVIRLFLTNLDEKNKNKVNIKNYLHINDKFDQTINISNIYLNPSNFEFFNIVRFDRFVKLRGNRGHILFMTFKKWLYQHFETIDLPRVLIFSSFIFYLTGLRQPSDLDVIVYHNPEKTVTKNFNKLMEEGSNRGYFGFIDLSCKNFGKWKNNEDCSYLDQWFLKDWPNLFGAKDYEDMIFNPRYFINFLGIKVISLEADLKRREKRCRSAAYANLISAKILTQANVKIPEIPESYWEEHVLKYYKTPKDKKVLICKIQKMLKWRYNIKMSISEISEYLHENPENY